jgi:hypothetical protein
VSVSERGFMRPELKFINLQGFLQWKIWGRSWPGGFRAYKNFKKSPEQRMDDAVK